MARDTEVGSVTVGVVPDATGIEQKLKDQIVPAAERVGEEAGNEMSNAIENKMTEGGDKSATRFEKSFKTRLKKALDNLPEAKIDGDVTDVERKIEELRTDIKTLHEQPLIDKGEAARAIDQVMLKVAALRAEAAGGIDIPVDFDTQSMLAEFETAITKIRGKAITGALVPGGMFSRIPFSGSASEKVLAASQQQAAAAAAPSMADIFVEAQALQFARDQASSARRASSFAHIPLAMGEIIQDVTGIGTARSKMFAAGPGGIADVIHGVIREAMPSSPYGGASFVAAADGVQKAVFSMSKEIELFRKPVGDIVRYSDNMATNSEEFSRLLKEIAPSPTFGFGTRDLGGRRVWTGLSGDRAFRGMAVPGGLLHDPGLGGYQGAARFAAGADSAIHDFSEKFSKDLVKFEKPMGDIVRYTANLNGTGQAIIRMSDIIEKSVFSDPTSQDKFFKKMTESVAKGFRVGRQSVISGLRGMVTRGNTGGVPPIVDDSGIPNVISALEARLTSGMPLTGELRKFAQFMRSDAAKALATEGKVTKEIIDAIEQRLTTGVPFTGELSKFARYIKLDAAKGVRRSLDDLIKMYGAGGGDVQKLLGEFGGGRKPADLSTLLKAFGAGGGDIGALLGTAEQGGAGGGGGGGILKMLFGGPQAIITAPGAVAGIAYLGQIFAGAIVTGLGTGLATLGVAGASKNAGVQKAATNFANIFSTALQQIGTPFIMPIENILKNAGKTIQKNTPTFNNAMATISSPLQDFINTIITTFSKPEVQKSIQAVAQAFADILNAVTPDVSKGMVAIANSITKMAEQVSANPQAFANFVTFLFGVANALIEITAAATGAANWLEKPGGVFGTIEDFFKHPLGNAPANWATNPLGKIIADLGSVFTPGGAVNKELMKIGGEIWHGILSGIDAAVSGTGRWIKTNIVNPLIRWMTAGFGIGSPAKVMIPIGKDIVDGIFAGIIAAWNTVKNFFTKTVPNNVKNWFSTAKTWLVTNGSDLISGLWGGITSYWNGTVKPFFTGLPDRLKGYFTTAINWLWDAGWNIASGIGTGISSFLSTVDSAWVQTHIFNPLKHAVFAYFGMGSPAKKTEPWGANIITGIVQGMMKEGKNIQKFAAKIFGSWPKAIEEVFTKSGGVDLSKMSKAGVNLLQSLFGPVATFPNKLGAAGKKAWQWFSSGHGGVSHWSGTVQKAMSLLHLPPSPAVLGAVLYQMQTESGGNPGAINLTDINAKRGDPSRGLMQVIGSTFSKWHVPNTSWNIYDPLANIAAAINYAIHGRGIGSGKYQLGSGGPYDQGGWLPTGVTLAYNLTGKPERILSPDEYASLQAGGTQYHAHFDGLTGQAIQAEVRTAFHMMSLTQGQLGRPGRRN